MESRHGSLRRPKLGPIRSIDLPRKELEPHAERLRTLGLGFLLLKWDVVSAKVITELMSPAPPEASSASLGAACLRGQPSLWEEVHWRRALGRTEAEEQGGLVWERKKKMPYGDEHQLFRPNSELHKKNGYRIGDYVDSFRKVVMQALMCLFFPNRTNFHSQYVSLSKIHFLEHVLRGESVNWSAAFLAATNKHCETLRSGAPIYLSPFLLHLYHGNGWLTHVEKQFLNKVELDTLGSSDEEVLSDCEVFRSGSGREYSRMDTMNVKEQGKDGSVETVKDEEDGPPGFKRRKFGVRSDSGAREVGNRDTTPEWAPKHKSEVGSESEPRNFDTPLKCAYGSTSFRRMLDEAVACFSYIEKVQQEFECACVGTVGSYVDTVKKLHRLARQESNKARLLDQVNNMTERSELLTKEMTLKNREILSLKDLIHEATEEQDSLKRRMEEAEESVKKLRQENRVLKDRNSHCLDQLKASRNEGQDRLAQARLIRKDVMDRVERWTQDLWSQTEDSLLEEVHNQMGSGKSEERTTRYRRLALTISMKIAEKQEAQNLQLWEIQKLLEGTVSNPTAKRPRFA